VLLQIIYERLRWNIGEVLLGQIRRRYLSLAYDRCYHRCGPAQKMHEAGCNVFSSAEVGGDVAEVRLILLASKCLADKEVDKIRKHVVLLDQIRTLLQAVSREANRQTAGLALGTAVRGSLHPTRDELA
jgi:hypothetical protein